MRRVKWCDKLSSVELVVQTVREQKITGDLSNRTHFLHLSTFLFPIPSSSSNHGFSCPYFTSVGRRSSDHIQENWKVWSQLARTVARCCKVQATVCLTCLIQLAFLCLLPKVLCLTVFSSVVLRKVLVKETDWKRGPHSHWIVDFSWDTFMWLKSKSSSSLYFSLSFISFCCP